MTQKERMIAGLPYKGWLDGLEEERIECSRKIYAFNLLPPDEYASVPQKLKEILGKTGDNLFIVAPFHCDYGWNIEVGNNFSANYNLTILDVGKGSVVTKDIPDWCIAVGNPCRVIRQITESDRSYYYKDRMFDVDDY